MKRALTIVTLVAILLVVTLTVDAQCAMCQATAETSHDAGASAADGINKGVMYILVMPYIIMGTIGYFWWRSRQKKQGA